MEITLPKRLNGSPFTINENKRLVTVVGANGSGKTRFVNQMVAEAGERAFRLSVIDALYPTKSDNTVNSVSKQYLQTVTNSPLVRANADTEFDMLLCLLAFDEMADLLSFKLENANTEDAKQKQLPVTKIDILIKLWTTIFPKSTILRSHGLIKIQNDVNRDPFNPFKMSHGEKAVFYYIGASLYAPKNSVIFVDSPTLFLHPSITQGLWNTIEELRPDCTFVYQTHDVEFSASRSNNLTIWVRHFDIVNTAWDYEIMQPHAALSEQLILDILGTRKPVLFIEGMTLTALTSNYIH
jgi:energy-coupling factor transporter ATP-binding protein EcfA2